jgi:hypothetical protein
MHLQHNKHSCILYLNAWDFSVLDKGQLHFLPFLDYVSWVHVHCLVWEPIFVGCNDDSYLEIWMVSYISWSLA